MSWSDITPEWVLEEVKTERMLLGLITILKPGINPVGDAEVLAYLMPASMRAPFTHEYYEIYMYIAIRVMDRAGKKVSDEIRQDTLSPDSERELKDLRHIIYTKRGGDINHPLLNAMRDLKKTCDKSSAKEIKDKAKYSGLLF